MNFSQFVRQTTVGWMLFFLIVLFVCSTPEVGYSQSNDSTTTEQVEGEKSEAKGINLLSLLFKGGWFMLPLMVLSGLIVAISVERIIALRAEKTIPPQFVESLGKLSMQSEGFDPRNAYRLCQGHPSSSARVVQAMLLKVGRPISEVESTVSETAQREADRLQSPIRWLELSAAIAPLIGLLGTVWGVTQAFYETTQLTAGQNKAAVLADGIYTALVTTICGLIIAIPAIVSFRLLEGADIYQIAKNCRTSVEMIEKHYAVHLKNSLDAAAINVRKSRK